MTIQKKSLITNRAAAKKAIIATHAVSNKFSATSSVVAKPMFAKRAEFAKPAPHLAKAPKVGKIVLGKRALTAKILVGKAAR